MRTATLRLTGTFMQGTVSVPVGDIVYWPRLDIGAQLPSELVVHDWLIGCSPSATATLLYTTGARQPILVAPGSGEAGLMLGLQPNSSHLRILFRQDRLVVEQYTPAGATVLAETAWPIYPLQGYTLAVRNGQILVDGKVAMPMPVPEPVGPWGYYLKPGAATRLGPVLADVPTWTTRQVETTVTAEGYPVDADSAQTVSATWPVLFGTSENALPFLCVPGSVEDVLGFATDASGGLIYPDSPVAVWWLNPAELLPPMPTGFHAAETGTDYIRWVWWNRTDYATGYLLYDEQDRVIATLPVSAGEYRESGLTPGTTYRRRLVATNANGPSPAATAEAATASGAPGEVPWAMALRVASDAVAVVWDAPPGAVEVEICDPLFTVLGTYPSRQGTARLVTGETQLIIRGRNVFGAGPARTFTAIDRHTASQQAVPLTGRVVLPISALWTWETPAGADGVRLLDENGSVIAALNSSTQSYFETGLEPGAAVTRYLEVIYQGAVSYPSVPVRLRVPVTDVAPESDGEGTRDPLVPLFVSGIGSGDDCALRTITPSSDTPLTATLQYRSTRRVSEAVYAAKTFHFRFTATGEQLQSTGDGTVSWTPVTLESDWYEGRLNSDGTQQPFRAVLTLDIPANMRGLVCQAEVDDDAVRYYWATGRLDGTTVTPGDTITFFSTETAAQEREVPWTGAAYHFRFSQAGTNIVSIPAPDSDPLYTLDIPEPDVDIIPGRDTRITLLSIDTSQEERWCLELDVQPLLPEHSAWYPTVAPGRVFYHNQPGTLVGDAYVSRESEPAAEWQLIPVVVRASGEVPALETPLALTLDNLSAWALGHGDAIALDGSLTLPSDMATGSFILPVDLPAGSFVIHSVMPDVTIPTGAAFTVEASADGTTWYGVSSLPSPVTALQLRLTFTGAAESLATSGQAVISTPEEWQAGSGSGVTISDSGLSLAECGTYTSAVLDLGDGITGYQDAVVQATGTVTVTCATADSPAGPWVYTAPAAAGSGRYCRIRLTSASGAEVSQVTLPFTRVDTRYRHAVVKSLTVHAVKQEPGGFVQRRGLLELPVLFDGQDHAVGTLGELLAEAGVVYADIPSPGFVVETPERTVDIHYTQNLTDPVVLHPLPTGTATRPLPLDLTEPVYIQPGPWVAAADEVGPVQILPSLDITEEGSGPSLALQYPEVDRSTLRVSVYADGRWYSSQWSLAGRVLTPQTSLPVERIRAQYRVNRSIALIPAGTMWRVDHHKITGRLWLWPGSADVLLPVDLHPLTNRETGYLVLTPDAPQVAQFEFEAPPVMLQGRTYTCWVRAADPVGNPVGDVPVTLRATGGQIAAAAERTQTDGTIAFLLTPTDAAVTVTASSGDLTRSAVFTATDLLATSYLQVTAPASGTVGTWLPVDLSWVQPAPPEASYLPLTVTAVGGRVAAAETDVGSEALTIPPRPDGTARVYVRADEPAVLAVRAQAGGASGSAIVVVSAS